MEILKHFDFLAVLAVLIVAEIYGSHQLMTTDRSFKSLTLAKQVIKNYRDDL